MFDQYIQRNSTPDPVVFCFYWDGGFSRPQPYYYIDKLHCLMHYQRHLDMSQYLTILLLWLVWGSSCADWFYCGFARVTLVCSVSADSQGFLQPHPPQMVVGGNNNTYGIQCELFPLQICYSFVHYS